MDWELIVLIVGIGLVVGGFFLSGIVATIMFIAGGACIGWFIGVVSMAYSIFSGF